MAVPLPPTVLLFTPYPTFATISGSVFGNDLTHTDTLVQIDRVAPEETVVVYQTGFPATEVTIPALGLLPDRTYRARMKYANSTGFSGFSADYFSLVLSDLAFPSIDVPLEPISSASAPLPLQPSFVIEPNRLRDMMEWKTETGDLVRRLPRTRERQSMILVWENLTTTEKNALVVFLNSRVAAVEAFDTTDAILGPRQFFIRQGQIQTIQKGPADGVGVVGVWNIQLDADEVFAKRFFTVGVSKIAGPDPIR